MDEIDLMWAGLLDHDGKHHGYASSQLFFGAMGKLELTLWASLLILRGNCAFHNADASSQLSFSAVGGGDFTL
ncbi:hypothetical protein N7463_010350 [Penicillium fimorum]|uniref:Uncharacterized protein n=1 Tax=Penicillium fimorum TaxID=1882269 RepID=A0A9W9XK09_9EURO|nr:hypothetical protein N7463_010350 [Penicillium fimorum]